MSFSIVLRSDAGIPRAGSLELKIAYALWETEGQPLPFTSYVLTLSLLGDSRLARYSKKKAQSEARNTRCI